MKSYLLFCPVSEYPVLFRCVVYTSYPIIENSAGCFDAGVTGIGKKSFKHRACYVTLLYNS